MSFLRICKTPSEGSYTYEDRLSGNYKKLFSVFKRGPSLEEAVITISNGVERSETDNASQHESQSDINQQADKGNSQTGADQQSDTTQQANTSGDSTNQSNETNDGFIRHNYSIMEAYTRLNRLYEDDSNQQSDNSQTDSAKETPDAAQQTDTNQQTNKTQQADKDTKSQEDSDEKTYTNDGITTLQVKVSLKNEGYSVWTLVLDSKVNVSKVKNALKSGKFAAAYSIASKSSSPAGLIISKLETFVSTDNEITCHSPFIGKCRYALDSGTSEDTSEDNSICMAIAPIDGRTDKPSNKIVFKVLYNVIDADKFTGGTLKSVVKKVDADKDKNNDNNYYSSNNNDNVNDLSKWLNDKFTCVGDSSTYSNFLKLRKFIEKSLKNKSIEFDNDGSETVSSFSNVSEVKKSIIAY